MNLKQAQYATDMRPIDEDCECTTCKTYSRAYLHFVAHEAVACSLLTVHNVAYQLRLMGDIRKSIVDGRFPEFIKEFMQQHYQNETIPEWIKEALAAVNVQL